jgi:hypothetical protein
MVVYVLMDWHDETEPTIAGVFSARERADAAIAKLLAAHDWLYAPDNFDVEEHRLDEFPTEAEE